jgi:exopolysaccharide production protein ExoQ
VQASDSLRPRLVVPLTETFVLIALLAFSTSLMPLMLGVSEGEADPLVSRAILVLVYATAGALAVTSGAVLGIIGLCPLVAGVLLLPGVSVLWSVAPIETIERTVGFLGTILLGFFLGWHYRLEAVIRLVGWAFVIGTLLSVATIVLLPSIGIDQTAHLAGSWLGVHMHKSKLGGASSAGAILLLYAALCSSGAARRLFAVCMVLNLVLLVGAGSATNLVATLIGLGLALFILVMQYQTRFGCLLLVVAGLFIPLITAIALHFDLFEIFVGALGKDATLTNRVPLWHLLWPFVMDRFWLGYGYNAFWESGLPWVDLIEARMNFLPHYSHNGIIELWLGGGLLLVVVYVSVFLLTLIKALVLARRGGASPATGYPFVFLMMVAMVNVTEARAMNRNDFLLVLFGVMIAVCARNVSLRLGRRGSETMPAAARLPDPVVR